MVRANKIFRERTLRCAFVAAQTLYLSVRKPKLSFTLDDKLSDTFITLPEENWQKMVLQIFVAIAHLDLRGPQHFNVQVCPLNAESMAFSAGETSELISVSMSHIDGNC